jgi:23S rRNA pseudouridine1911/1915/1917 synthase
MITPEILYPVMGTNCNAESGAVVAIKPAGVISEDAGEGSMPRLLATVLAGRGITGRIMTVHRLDKIVGGLMVYSLGEKSAAALTAQIGGREVTKEYLAVVHGTPEADSGILTDLLYHDQNKNKTYVVDRNRKGVREARLEYRLCGKAVSGADMLSLVAVRLITGRTHQIRAQFAARKMPLWGDARYGSPVRGGNISLWSAHLSFTDPVTGGIIDIKKVPPDEYPWQVFKNNDRLTDFIGQTTVEPKRND